MNNTCIFCKIISGDVPGDVLYKDESIIVLADVQPKAPVHLLVLPVRHVDNLAEFTATAAPGEARDFIAAAARFGEERSPEGFRVVINSGTLGGQTVQHLHAHVIGGRTLTWPPG
ncbi:MAG: HIT family protein [Candidatus Eremiobacteraeota bacterium]|nr:HIT family protein [Candidatus Eremiobacteraeota bacterium]